MYILLSLSPIRVPAGIKGIIFCSIKAVSPLGAVFAVLSSCPPETCYFSHENLCMSQKDRTILESQSLFDVLLTAVRIFSSEAVPLKNCLICHLKGQNVTLYYFFQCCVIFAQMQLSFPIDILLN